VACNEQPSIHCPGDKFVDDFKESNRTKAGVVFGNAQRHTSEKGVRKEPFSLVAVSMDSSFVSSFHSLEEMSPR